MENCRLSFNVAVVFGNTVQNDESCKCELNPKFREKCANNAEKRSVGQNDDNDTDFDICWRKIIPNVTSVQRKHFSERKFH